MRWILITLAMLFALVSVSGCPKAPQTAPGSAAVEATADDEGEPVAGRGTHSANDSRSKSERADSAGSQGAPAAQPEAQLPDIWPAELPPYPGSVVTAATTRPENGGTFVALMLQTPDPAAAVLKYYDEIALAAGFKKKTELPLPAEGGSVVYESDAATLTVESNRAAKETSTHVSLIYKIKPLIDAKPLEQP